MDSNLKLLSRCIIKAIRTSEKSFMVQELKAYYKGRLTSKFKGVGVEFVLTFSPQQL